MPQTEHGPGSAADVIGPATNTADNIPQWDGANSKTLKDGLATNVASGVCVLDGSGDIASTMLPAGTCIINSGTYNGNGTVGTAIAHGLGVTPSMVRITSAVSGRNDCGIWIAGSGAFMRETGAQATNTTTSAPDATNFYLPGNVPPNRSDATTYYWVAYGKIA